MYKTDYHIHTIYSDGQSDFHAYIDKAVETGFSEIGFSEHLAIDNEFSAVSIDLNRINNYIDELINIREKRSDIKIRIGFEVDYDLNAEEKISKITRSLPLDYVIGSVHFLEKGGLDMTPDFYKDKDINLLWEEYFMLVEKAAESGLFDIIGHIDLIRIFGYYPQTDISHYYKSMAKKLKAHNLAFEINTNGFNKHVNDFYPDRKFLHHFYREGIPVCVNSDAHKPERVGQFFDVAYSVLRETGYKQMVTFEKRNRRSKSF